jgi:hypothetical protein
MARSASRFPGGGLLVTGVALAMSLVPSVGLAQEPSSWLGTHPSAPASSSPGGWWLSGGVGVGWALSGGVLRSEPAAGPTVILGSGGRVG